MSSQGREINNLGYYPILAAGDIAPARPGWSMKMLCYTALSSAAGTIQFTSDIAGDALTGAMPVAAGGGISTTLNALGHFESNVGETIAVAAAGGADAAGHVTIEWLNHNPR